MKNRKRPELNREENHFVKATLIVDGTEINDVPCKIYLPERTHEKPYMIFKPSNEDAPKIIRVHKVAFKAATYGFDKAIETTFDAPEVYFKESSTRHWGTDISESSIHAEPQDLHIVHYIRNHEGKEKTDIVFWVSPNKFLTPFMSCMTSYTGEIKYERIGNLKFRIKGDLELTFEKHFSSKTTENDDFVQWSYLVACVESSVPANDAETLKKILHDIDDFLLIASLALRKRTVCMGWTADDKHSYTTFYRGNYSFPDNSDKSDIDDGLVSVQDFGRFIETGYTKFLIFENKLALRYALHSAVPSMAHTIETSFLNRFAGLETLILDFRRSETLEFVMPEMEWADLKMYLQDCIKKSAKPKLIKKQRALIYDKLGELNRISLREAFHMFCQKYAINLSDLWPVFSEKGIVGLADIRNRLIHGDPFPKDLYGALIVAKEHLKYILETALVGILGWNVWKTNIAPGCLNKHLKDSPTEQTRLSEYINGQ